MAESKVRDDNYFQVSGWMLNRLNLKGVSLQVFSIIYGFSQDGESYFTGSLQYLMDFTNASKPTIIKSLKELVEKGFVLKFENEMNGVKFNKYRANLLVVKELNRGSQETLPGGSQISLPGGSQETLPNNISLIDKPLIDKEKVNEVKNLYNTICVSYPTLRVLSDKRQKAIKKILERFSIEDIRTVFENAESSSFMKGKNDRKWSATFDWMMNEDNLIKVLEGNYADKRGRKEAVPGWMEHSLGDAELEAIQRVLNEPDPELADRAEKLRQRLQDEMEVEDGK
jgi:DNA-binding Lrp family transcriptional regulator